MAKFPQKDTGLTVVGVDELNRRLARIAKKAPKRAGKALLSQANLIMGDSKENYVPVDDGPLKSSGDVELPVIVPGETVFVRLVYGGTTAPYALAIHEHLSAASPPSWQNVGRLKFQLGHAVHKFLEKPMNAAIPGFLRQLAKDIDLGGL
jgi:hypothetical protein